MGLETITNDLSISISGHNIKPFAEAAIKSLAKIKVDYLKKVVYFDDYSTDGTKELLEDLGVRVIGWLPEVEEMFHSMQDFQKDLPTRVSFINECIFRQVDTKYLYMSDGDVIFKKDIISLLAGIMAEYCPDMVACTNEYDMVMDGYSIIKERVYLNQALLDLPALKKMNVLGDDIRSCLVDDDTGTSFLSRMRFAGTNLHELKQQELTDYYYHFEWTSSSMRDDDEQNMKEREINRDKRLQSIEQAFLETHQILEDIGVEKENLSAHILKNFYKSPIY